MATPSGSMDKYISQQMCKMMSLEYDVEKSDLAPFIAMLNILQQEYAHSKPELFCMLIAVLHDYNPYLGKEHRHKTMKYIEILLDAQPVLREYLMSVLPELTPHTAPTGLLNMLPAKLSSVYVQTSARNTPYQEGAAACIGPRCPTAIYAPVKGIYSHSAPWLAGTTPGMTPGMTQGYKVMTPVYCPPWFTVSSASTTSTVPQTTGHRLLPVRLTSVSSSMDSNPKEQPVTGHLQRMGSAVGVQDSLSYESMKQAANSTFRNSASFPYSQQVVLPGVKGHSLFLQSLPFMSRSQTNAATTDHLGQQTGEVTMIREDNDNITPEPHSKMYMKPSAHSQPLLYNMFMDTINNPSRRVDNKHGNGRMESGEPRSAMLSGSNTEQGPGPIRGRDSNHQQLDCAQNSCNDSKTHLPTSVVKPQATQDQQRSQLPSLDSAMVGKPGHVVNSYNEVEARGMLNMQRSGLASSVEAQDSADSDEAILKSLIGEKRSARPNWSGKKEKHRRKRKRHH